MFRGWVERRAGKVPYPRDRAANETRPAATGVRDNVEKANAGRKRAEDAILRAMFDLGCERCVGAERENETGKQAGKLITGQDRPQGPQLEPNVYISKSGLG